MQLPDVVSADKADNQAGYDRATMSAFNGGGGNQITLKIKDLFGFRWDIPPELPPACEECGESSGGSIRPSPYFPCPRPVLMAGRGDTGPLP